MGRYVDGYVLPVPEDQVEEYREMAAEAGEIWVKHGALEYVEAVGDDMEPVGPDGKPAGVRSFTEMVDAAEDETVVFAFVVYESREHRDEVNEKVMSDPAMQPDGGEIPMPFDVERMAYGGFRTIVDRDDR